jgi:putative serine protease PepD
VARRPVARRSVSGETAAGAARAGRPAHAHAHQHQHRRAEPSPVVRLTRALPAAVGRTDQPEADPGEVVPTAAGPVRGRGVGRRVLVAAMLVAGVIGGLVGGTFVAWLGPSHSASAGPGMVISTTVPVEGTGSVADVAAKALPSVVKIEVQGQENSTGSGVIIRPDGYILTNAHVIGAAAADTKIMVTLDQDVSPITAQVVGADPKTDLAVLRIQVGQPLRPAVLGQSGALRVGSPVIAIGAPIGLPGSVSTGIISGLDRSPLEPAAGGGSIVLAGAIQTDAAINPGSSGGPLLDSFGQVIGLNTAVGTVPGGSGGQPGNIGIGFAIPIDYARAVAQELIETGHATHPYLGVSAETVTAAAAASSGRVPGVLIRDLDGNGPAAAAGLRIGDLVTKIDRADVTTADQLLEAARARHVGDHLTVTYVRAGHTATAQVTLTEQAG